MAQVGDYHAEQYQQMMNFSRLANQQAETVAAAPANSVSLKGRPKASGYLSP